MSLCRMYAWTISAMAVSMDRNGKSRTNAGRFAARPGMPLASSSSTAALVTRS